MKLSDVCSSLGDLHPLVNAIAQFEASQTLMDLHRNYTICKTLQAYMRYREELSVDEAQVVGRYLEDRVKVMQPGTQQKKYC